MRIAHLASIVRLLFFRSSRNSRTFEGLGFFHVMEPHLRRWAANGEGICDLAARHMGYFNADFILSSYIAGVVINLEERKMAGEDIAPDRIERMKSVLSAASTAKGSYFFEVILLPLGLTIGSIFAIYNSYIGIAIFLVLYNFYHLRSRIGGYLKGVRLGDRIGREHVEYFFREQGLLGGSAACVSGAFAALALTRAYEMGGSRFAVWGVIMMAGMMLLRKKLPFDLSVLVVFLATVIFLAIW